MTAQFKFYVCRCLLGAVMVCAVGGCKLHQKYSQSIWPLDKKEQPQVPAKLAATWSDTVSYVPGKPAMRGFGGRLYFYDRRMNAIKVDGRLVVYIFDDELANGNKDQPQRKFQFSAEDFSRHCTGSDLGPSYSVWIPWDAVGGPTKQLSIVPFFVPTEGGLVTGEQTRHRLPGMSPASTEATPPAAYSSNAADGRYGARQVSYEQAATSPAGAVNPRPIQFRSTTINVTPATRDRLLQATGSTERVERQRTGIEHSELVAGGRPLTGSATFTPATFPRSGIEQRFSRPRPAPWEAGATTAPE